MIAYTERLKLAEISLLGLSVGDSFGQQFFLPLDELKVRLDNEVVPSPPWYFTDDTIMAMGVYDVLQNFGEINQDSLAKTFAANYLKNNSRGYGGTAHRILREFSQGKLWKDVSSSVFDGMGSMGNGAAMRAGLIGAYFYDDLPKAVTQSKLSAEITHFHAEGQIGAVAVTLAAAIACQTGLQKTDLRPNDFLEKISSFLPESETLSGIRRSLTISPKTNIQTVVDVLGNGSDMISQKTVPFTLWVAAHNINNYENAIWTAVNGLGDRDTTCAIVGSIVCLSSKKESIPESWIKSSESIYNSEFLTFLQL